MKGKVYKTAVRLALMYGMETVALTKRQEAELVVAVLLRVTRRDKIRNEYISGTVQVECFGG